MNLRRKTPPDSLYLLLDTLCNAFGGIILLAVLVVLLTSKEKSQSATSSDSQEMLQRRLALSQTNLQQSLQLAASLNAKANDPRWKQQVALLSTRKELQDAIQQTRDTIKTGVIFGRQSIQWFPWVGTRVLRTLSLLAKSAKIVCDKDHHRLALAYQLSSPNEFFAHLREITNSQPDAVALARLMPDKAAEKYDDLHPPPGSGDLPLGFCARSIFTVKI